ncbi:MAG TPA: transcription antitermination factor NusB [Victivallales bacterium]|nr:transcription antitermination factor NusB [Victivallales bacterium]
MIKIPEKILASAVKGIEYCEMVSSLDDFLDYKFIRSEEPNYKTVVSILFNYFRNKTEIDYCINSLAIKKVKPFLRRVISVALVQIFYQSGIPDYAVVDVAVSFTKKRKGKVSANFVNAIIRKSIEYKKSTTSENNIQPEYVIKKLPKPLYDRWKLNFTENQFIQICDALAKEAEFTFRAINKFELTVKNGMEFQKVHNLNYLNHFTFYKSETPAKIIESDLLKTGKIYIQDPAAVMGGELLLDINPEKILDLCAAPGGKTLMLSELFPDAEITASDRSAKRLERVNENILKYNRENIKTVHCDAFNNSFKANEFDLILLDVPCSNSGVIRRRPDVMWNFTNKKLTEITLLQKQILSVSAKLVKHGGRIIYSTCSIEKEENIEQVSDFISNNDEFYLEKQQLLLPSINNDGAYAAILCRK